MNLLKVSLTDSFDLFDLEMTHLRFDGGELLNGCKTRCAYKWSV